MPPDNIPPTIVLTDMVIGAVADQISMAGTAADNIGVDHVSWANADTGGSGACGWSDPDWDCDIAVQAGDNRITITAVDTSNNEGSVSLTVNYTAAAGGGTTVIKKVYMVNPEAW